MKRILVYSFIALVLILPGCRYECEGERFWRAKYYEMMDIAEGFQAVAEDANERAEKYLVELQNCK